MIKRSHTNRLLNQSRIFFWMSATFQVVCWMYLEVSWIQEKLDSQILPQAILTQNPLLVILVWCRQSVHLLFPNHHIWRQWSSTLSYCKYFEFSPDHTDKGRPLFSLYSESVLWSNGEPWHSSGHFSRCHQHHCSNFCCPSRNHLSSKLRSK